MKKIFAFFAASAGIGIFFSIVFSVLNILLVDLIAEYTEVKGETMYGFAVYCIFATLLFLLPALLLYMFVFKERGRTFLPACVVFMLTLLCLSSASILLVNSCFFHPYWQMGAITFCYVESVLMLEALACFAIFSLIARKKADAPPFSDVLPRS